MLSCERVSFIVTSFRVSSSLGQLSAGRGNGGNADVFHKTSAGTACDEKMKNVCCCVHLLCLSVLLGVCWVLFLQGVERVTSVRMREAYPAAALLMCVVSRCAGE